jgi:hypothetical protein
MQNSTSRGIARPACMWPRAVVIAAALATGVCACSPAAEPGSVVRVEQGADGGWRLIRDGRPFVVHGVGGTAALDMLAACGGNALRTWDAASALAEVDGRSLIERAHDRGLAVTVGLWLGHERHGFRYDDDAMLARQRATVAEDVRRLRDFPGLLCWGLGNEMEGPTGRGDSAAVWAEVGRLAKTVKSLDPHHPVMTVVANVNPAKVRAIRDHAPAIDILGVNAYSGAAGIGDALRRMGWTKPYCITEYGLPGPWEAEETTWNAPLEPTSRRKAATYNVTTTDILSDTRQCLGAYAFLWGSKQEATASWFGMLLPTGEKTITVDAVTQAWTGRWPANRAPVLGTTDVPLAGRRVTGDTAFTVTASYRDPEGDELSYAWEVRRENVDRKEGGDAEAEPELIDECVLESDDKGMARICTPTEPGPYRLFVTVRDGHGSGCIDNWPFFVDR